MIDRLLNIRGAPLREVEVSVLGAGRVKTCESAFRLDQVRNRQPGTAARGRKKQLK